MERLEKKNEERKDGDLVDYESEYSDLNNNIENQNIEVKSGGSNEIKNVENQIKPENIKGNRYLNM